MVENYGALADYPLEEITLIFGTEKKHHIGDLTLIDPRKSPQELFKKYKIDDANLEADFPILTWEDVNKAIKGILYKCIEDEKIQKAKLTMSRQVIPRPSNRG